MLTNPSESLPFLLHDLARHFRYAFEVRTRLLGVTRPQYRALLHLSRNPGATQSELADLLDVERITLGRMIDRMEAAGLVERRADPTDRRVWRLHNLPAAEPILSRLTEIGSEVEREAMVHLAPGEDIELARLVKKMRDGMRGVRCEKPQVTA